MKMFVWIDFLNGDSDTSMLIPATCCLFR